MSKHTVVFIDHKEARIFRLQPGATAESTIHAPHFIHRHPKESDRAKDYPDETRRFFHEVASALADTEGTLIVGPSTAKLDLLRYVQKHDHLLEQKIIGVETVDHPTDKQIIAYAKEYFNLAAQAPAE